MTLATAVFVHAGALGLGFKVLLALATAALFGTTITAPQSQTLIPSTSPDQDTALGQAENLRAQFEVLTGTTDVIQGGGGSLAAISATGGAVPIAGRSIINSTGVDACTLATPVAGNPAAGGNDGLEITVVDIGGHAHTVTTAANKINGNKHVATFPGTVGAQVKFVAYNGIWYTDG